MVGKLRDDGRRGSRGQRDLELAFELHLTRHLLLHDQLVAQSIIDVPPSFRQVEDRRVMLAALDEKCVTAPLGLLERLDVRLDPPGVVSPKQRDEALRLLFCDPAYDVQFSVIRAQIVLLSGLILRIL